MNWLSVLLQNGSKHDAATNYVDASTCYKKSDPNQAAASLQKAIDIYTGKKKIYIYKNSVIIDCYTDCIFAFVQGQLTSSCIMNHSFLGIEVKFLFLLTLWNCGSIFVYINCKHLYSICCIFIFFLLLNRVCNVIFYLFFHDTNSSGPLKKQANTFFNSFSISPRYYIIKLTKIWLRGVHDTQEPKF